MANAFEGKPDDRQSDDIIPVSRFRPKYRALTDYEMRIHDQIKEQAVELERLFELVGKGRYQSLALTSLEESIMWIVKELTK